VAAGRLHSEFQTIVEFGNHNQTQLHFDRNSIDLFCCANELMNYMYGILVIGDFARESDKMVLQYCYILQEVCAYMAPSQYFWMASDVDEQNPSARLCLVDCGRVKPAARRAWAVVAL
jgi:hypothetical protein